MSSDPNRANQVPPCCVTSNATEEANPLRRASEAIGGQIAAALAGKRGGSVVQLKSGRRR